VAHLEEVATVTAMTTVVEVIHHAAKSTVVVLASMTPTNDAATEVAADVTETKATAAAAAAAVALIDMRADVRKATVAAGIDVATTIALKNAPTPLPHAKSLLVSMLVAETTLAKTVMPAGKRTK